MGSILCDFVDMSFFPAASVGETKRIDVEVFSGASLAGVYVLRSMVECRCFMYMGKANQALFNFGEHRSLVILEIVGNMGIESSLTSVGFPIGLVVFNVFVNNGCQPVLPTILALHVIPDTQDLDDRSWKDLCTGWSRSITRIYRGLIRPASRHCHSNVPTFQSSDNGNARTNSPVLPRREMCLNLNPKSRLRSPDFTHPVRDSLLCDSREMVALAIS